MMDDPGHHSGGRPIKQRASRFSRPLRLSLSLFEDIFSPLFSFYFLWSSSFSFTVICFMCSKCSRALSFYPSICVRFCLSFYPSFSHPVGGTDLIDPDVRSLLWIDQFNPWPSYWIFLHLNRRVFVNTSVIFLLLAIKCFSYFRYQFHALVWCIVLSDWIYQRIIMKKGCSELFNQVWLIVCW